MVKTFKEFVEDYNEFYHCNLNCINCDTHSIFRIVNDLYNTDEFEINDEEETIELF